MPRFSVLTHDHPFPHWDFLLEHGPVCRTWRLRKSPDTSGEIPAEALPDHRLMYLEYEGPVSGDRGTVSVWDTGTFDWLVRGETVVEVKLMGCRLNGVVRLRCGQDSWVWSVGVEH